VNIWRWFLLTDTETERIDTILSRFRVEFKPHDMNTEMSKHDYTRTRRVTNMLTDLQWDTLQQRYNNTRTTMRVRLSHNHVDIEPDPPVNNASSNRGHTQRLV